MASITSGSAAASRRPAISNAICRKIILKSVSTVKRIRREPTNKKIREREWRLTPVKAFLVAIFYGTTYVLRLSGILLMSFVTAGTTGGCPLLLNTVCPKSFMMYSTNSAARVGLGAFVGIVKP